MDDDRYLNVLDDFELLAERTRLMRLIASLTEQYRTLNAEMSRRGTLAWMLR